MNSFTKLAFSIKKKQSTNLLKALGLTGATATGLGLGHVLHNSMLGTEALEQAAALNKARRQYSKLVEAVDQTVAEGKAMNNALPTIPGSQLKSDISHLTVPSKTFDMFGELPKPITGNAPIFGVTDNKSIAKRVVEEMMTKAKQDEDFMKKLLSAKVIPKAVEPQAKIPLTDDAVAKLQAKLKSIPENDWDARKARMDSDAAKFEFEKQKSITFDKMRRNMQGNAKIDPYEAIKVSPETQNKILKVFKSFSEPIGGTK
jgi:hypothetical protein